MVWMWLAVGQATEWRVDGTSLHLARGGSPVARSVACPAPPPDAPQLDDLPLVTRGVAVVAYSKKQGTMAWGHSSLRAVYCHGASLVDVEYEIYRLSDWNEAQLRREHADEDFVTGDWLTTQRGALALFRNPDPVDGGWFAQAQAKNREIYEVWLDLDQADLDAVVLAAQGAHRDQLEVLRRRGDLTGRYRLLSTNCTTVFQDFLPPGLVDGRPITPFAWVRQLQDDAALLVLHPSHHLVNRWGAELPEVVERQRPVFRRSKVLARDGLAGLIRDLQDDAPVLPEAAAPAPSDGIESADRPVPPRVPDAP